MRTMFQAITAIVVFALAASVSGDKSGDCGLNATWAFESETAELTISGEGKTYDFSDSSRAPWYSFRGEIASVVVEKNITYVGTLAFVDCANLTTVKIPSTVNKIAQDVFSGCVKLISIDVEATNANYSSDGGVLFNKDKTTIVTVPAGRSGIYTIPSTVTTIGDGAFQDCTLLNRVAIPSSVETIGNSAFRKCSNMTSIIIPDSVKTIGDEAFSKCRSLESIAVPGKVTSIGDAAFKECISLTHVSIPSSVNELGEDVFKECMNLQTVNILANISSIDDGMFKACSNLTVVKLPTTVTTIGDGAFYGCESLTSFSIPPHVSVIEEDAFYGCSSLTYVVIPENVTHIKTNTFRACTSLTFVSLPLGVTTISDGAFRDCSSLKSVVIPDTVTTVEDNVFKNCIGLTYVTIPENVTNIEKNTFSGCVNLTSVIYLGNSSEVTDVLQHSCKSLTSMCVYPNKTEYDNLENQCFEALCIDSELASQERVNASEWENMTNACVEFTCDNSTGGNCKSKCSSICLSNKCAEIESLTKDGGFAVEIDLNEVKMIDFLHANIFNDIEVLTQKSSAKWELGFAMNNNGSVVTIYISLSDRKTAEAIAKAVNNIVHDENCNFDILCESITAHVLGNINSEGSLASGASSVHEKNFLFITVLATALLAISRHI